MLSVEGGSCPEEVNRGSGATGRRAARELPCDPLVLTSVVVTAHFLCCSVKLPLFCLFLPILLPTPAEGAVIQWPRGPLLLARAKPRHFHVQEVCE